MQAIDDAPKHLAVNPIASVSVPVELSTRRCLFDPSSSAEGVLWRDVVGLPSQAWPLISDTIRQRTNILHQRGVSMIDTIPLSVTIGTGYGRALKLSKQSKMLQSSLEGMFLGIVYHRKGHGVDWQVLENRLRSKGALGTGKEGMQTVWDDAEDNDANMSKTWDDWAEREEEVTACLDRASRMVHRQRLTAGSIVLGGGERVSYLIYRVD